MNCACFPATARLTLENGKSITMSELQTGDKVQTGINIVCHSSRVKKACGSILFIVEENFEKDKSCNTGRERLIRSHSSARFCFELSRNSN